jgi:hypothetical protein
MCHLNRVLGVAVAAVLLGVVPARANGQNSAPCPSENTFTQASNEIGSTATTAASTGTTVAAAEAKLKGIFTKPKPSATTTTTTTGAAAKAPTTVAAAKPPAAPAVPAAAPAATAGAAKSATAAPCGGGKAAAGSSTTAANTAPTSPAAASQKPATAAAGTGAAVPGVTAVSGTPAFTLMPDGEYMLAYDSPDPAHKKTYAKVKKVSEGTQAGHPSDGVYTDDKNFYVVTGGQMVLTPANGAPAH